MTNVERLRAEYASEKTKISFFDATCWLGSPVPGALGDVPSTAGQLLKLIDRCGVEKAVVSSSAALHRDAADGNEKLLAGIRRSSRLYAAAILSPKHVARLPDLSGHVSRLIDNKVVMARLFPKLHDFALSNAPVKILLRLLEERRLPVVLWHTQTTWDEIDRLCGTYPRLPVIAEGVGRKLFYDNRIFYPLLEKHRNLFLGTHNLTNYLGMDDIVLRFGAEKLIFGTFIPVNDPEAALMPVAYGDFGLKEKRKIAAGNLRLLIRKIRM